MFEVKKAKRSRRPLKINLEGVSGSGKTFSALRLAFAMRRAGIGTRIVVADSENESAGLYDGINIDGEKWEYDVCPIPPEKQTPLGYVEVYEYLTGQGYNLIIGDSLTHAWHGAQEIVDAHAQRNKGDKFGGWSTVTPQQRKMLSTLTDGRAHFIGTMRVKSEYERMEGANGKPKMQKIGMKTDQRDGAEYEFDCVIRLDQGHEARVEKVRGCTAMDGKVGVNPGPEFWKPLFDWWLSAEPVVIVTPEDVARRRYAESTSLTALGVVWDSLPADVRKATLADKDRRKAELTPAPKPEGEKRPDPPVAASAAVNPTPTVVTSVPGANALGATIDPTTGPELLTLMQALELTLVAEKLCVPGALKAHVIQAGAKHKCPPDLSTWNQAAVAIGVTAAREFEASVRFKALVNERDEPEALFDWRDKLGERLDELGTSYNDQMVRHGMAACGWDQQRNPCVPDVERLSIAEIQHLLQLVNQSAILAGKKQTAGARK